MTTYTKKEKKDKTKKKQYPQTSGKPKFISRSVHGSGAFTDQDI